MNFLCSLVRVSRNNPFYFIAIVTVDFKARLLGAIAHGEPIKVGCRGFASPSLVRVFSSLDTEGERRRKTIHIIINAVERASRWLWLKRGELWNHSGQLTGQKVGSNGPQLGHLDEGL